MRCNVDQPLRGAPWITLIDLKIWHSLMLSNKSIAILRLATGNDCLSQHLHRMIILLSRLCQLCNTRDEMEFESLPCTALGALVGETNGDHGTR